MPAAEAGFPTDADSVAVRGDGLVAFSMNDDVWWIRQGRLSRMPSLPTSGTDTDTNADTVDLAFAPDGALLMASCGTTIPKAVWRVTPGGLPQRIAGQLRAAGFSGDGGPAIDARLGCPSGVAVDTAGGILIADSDARRVRRVDPAGGITTVAGNGREAVSGDGGPAAQAAIGAPVDVAALPQGGFAVADHGVHNDVGTRTKRGGVRIVNADGVIATRSPADAWDLDALADGSLLYADYGGGPIVRRLLPDGHSVVAANLLRDRVGLPTEIPILGDPFGVDENTFDVSAVAVTPDGGMLASWNFAIRYVPPPVPAMLAVALGPATRVPRSALVAHLTLTAPAHVTAQALRRGRKVATSVADLPAGNVVLPFTGRISAGEALLRVRATGADGQIATAQAWVFPKGVLPVAWTRSLVQSRLDLMRTYQDAPATTATCRSVADRRVDCALRSRRRCAGVLVARLRTDGSVSLLQYDGGRRCRLR